jgi:hypothetical protein
MATSLVLGLAFALCVAFDPSDSAKLNNIFPDKSDSAIFSAEPNHQASADTVSQIDSLLKPIPNLNDAIELPEKTVKSTSSDSFSREFKKYWAQVEKADGFDKLKEQYRSRDIDKTWVPHFYLFDSAVVVFPFWFVIRKRK